MTSHTISTTKGTHTGTLREVCAWQAEYQGGFATVDGVDVDTVDFDADDLSECVAEVRALLAAERAS